jgi:hypothetical protein
MKTNIGNIKIKMAMGRIGNISEQGYTLPLPHIYTLFFIF